MPYETATDRLDEVTEACWAAEISNLRSRGYDDDTIESFLMMLNGAPRPQDFQFQATELPGETPPATSAANESLLKTPVSKTEAETSTVLFGLLLEGKISSTSFLRIITMLPTVWPRFLTLVKEVSKNPVLDLDSMRRLLNLAQVSAMKGDYQQAFIFTLEALAQMANLPSPLPG